MSIQTCCRPRGFWKTALLGITSLSTCIAAVSVAADSGASFDPDTLEATQWCDNYTGSQSVKYWSKGYDIDFSNAGGKTTFLDTGSLYDRELRLELKVNLKGCEDERRAWLSPSQNYTGNGNTAGHALAIEVQPTPWRSPVYSATTDKIMWDLRNKDTAGVVPFGYKQYIAFALKIAGNTDEIAEPGRNYLLLQFWQGVPFHPPISFHLTNSKISSDYVRVEIRHYETIYHDDYTVIGGFDLRKGHWNELLIGYKGGYDDNGWVSLYGRYGNGYIRLVHKSGFNTAYDPDTYRSGRHPNDHLLPSFGIYRRRQDQFIKLFFDDMRVRGSFLEASMGLPAWIL